MKTLDDKKLYNAAMKAGEWLCNTQITETSDANRGRFPFCLNARTHKCIYSSNWRTAIGIMALIALYNKTGHKKYLDRAILSGEYIKTLQVLDSRKPELYGSIKEDSPQDFHSHPRDAITAAWSFIYLYEETKNEEYLSRAKIFADWHLNYSFDRNWPVWDVFYDGGPHNYHQGSFQSGSGLFYYKLYDYIRDEKLIKHGLKRIADVYCDRFIDEDGRIKVIYNPETDSYTDLEHLYGADWQQMHRVNDDFGGLMLIAAYKLFGNSKYLDRVKKFADWLIKQQLEDGSFCRPVMHCASATTPILLLDLYKLTEIEKYYEVSQKSIKHLLATQYFDSNELMTDGGFLGMSPMTEVDGDPWIDMRSVGYAVIALLKAMDNPTVTWLSVV